MDLPSSSDALCQSCFVKNVCFYELFDLPVFHVQFLIPLLVSTGLAPLAGIKCLGTQPWGIEAFSQGPALPSLPAELPDPPLGMCVHVCHFEMDKV